MTNRTTTGAADDESTSFDPIAPFYDEIFAYAEVEEVVKPAVDFLVDLAGTGRALELGIGTGRLALRLAARGVDVTGIELSQGLVAKLREKPGGDSIPVVVGDFSVASANGPFSLAYIPRNTLWNLRTQDKQVACFRNVSAQLEIGGRFVVELFVPDLHGIAPGRNIRALRADAGRLSFDVFDPVSQGLTSVHHWLRKDGILSFAGQGRYVWPAELDLMARLAGMELENRWAGWKKEPFTERSASHVSVYRKPDPGQGGAMTSQHHWWGFTGS
jgi:SAM-dependent methyltransferase